VLIKTSQKEKCLLNRFPENIREEWDVYKRPVEKRLRENAISPK